MKNYFSFLFSLLLGGFMLTLAIGSEFPGANENMSSRELENDSAADPFGIFGPDRICLVFGSVLEEFYGGGISGLDVYRWKIIGPSNEILFDLGEKSSLQTLPFTYSKVGMHKVELRIRRGSGIVYEGSKMVEVVKGPTVMLKENYILCEGSDLTLNAIDPLTPDIDDYIFEWQDGGGNPLGVSTNNIMISGTGNFKVRYYFVDSNGIPECEILLSTNVASALEFSLSSTKDVACPGDFIQVSPSISLFGSWSYEKEGNGIKKPISDGRSLGFNPAIDLEGYGNYTIYFTVANPDIPGCIINKPINFKYLPNAEYELASVTPTSGCLNSDGALSIRAITDLDQLYFVVNDSTTSPIASMKAGEVYVFPNLSSGIYSFVGELGGCPFRLAAVVPLSDIPTLLDFSIEEIYNESCTVTGKDLGGFTVRFPNGPVEAFYNLVDERGGMIGVGKIESVTELLIEVQGGIYYFEVFDKDECTLPWEKEIEIKGLPQVDLPVIEDFNICETYDFIPQSNDDVVFTLTFPDGRQEIQDKGNPFNIELAGDYFLFATHKSDPDICPRQQEFTVGLISAVDFEVDFFNQDCVGNQTYRAVLKNKLVSEVEIRWYNENDEVIGTGLELFPTSYGTFKLDVQPANSFACPIPAKEFEVKIPVLQVEVDLTASPLCPFGPGALIALEIASDIDEVDRIEWVYFDPNDNQNPLGAEKNKTFIIATQAGIYEVSVWNRFGCELGRNLVEIKESTDLVSFKIDPIYTVCESYRWIPETKEPLNFILTYPNGEKVSKKSSETFNLSMAGNYTIRGENVDPDNLSCPNEKTFEVVLVKPIVFEPVLLQQSCDGEFSFEANIPATDLGNALFIWTNEGGQIVSDKQFFNTKTPGNYFLEVQPKGSLPCDVSPIPFVVKTPILDLQLSMNVGTLCPEAVSALITVDTEMEPSDRIEWWFTDFAGIRSPLTAHTGKKEISVQKEGTYEVLVFNEIPCLIGQDRALLMRSMDEIRPIVSEKYLICGQYGVGENINPGFFSSYNWYLGEDLVSTSPIFKPQAPGDYSLVVNSLEACEYTATFIVNEDCDMRVSLPTGIRPEDPDRAFLVYTNHLVDELEVWVFNKWGTNIFHCANNNLISEASTCIWDGTFKGKKIPVGSYAVKIYYKNIEQNITKTFVESILVID